jgi:hypothetical protein
MDTGSQEAHMGTARTLALIVAASLALVAWSNAGAGREEARSRAEAARIGAHLARVEQALLAADVSHLSEVQRSNRLRHVAVLRAYRERGVFPHNHDVPGRVPVFIDEHGTHCAVGHLIAQSGHAALARRIAAERNLARVQQLAGVPELVAWLDEAGLALEEAAAIQPAYNGPPLQPAPRTSTGYPTATAITAAIGGGTVLWNALTDRTGRHWWIPGVAGVGAGAAGITLAALGAADDDDHDDIEAGHIAVNAGIGLIAGLLGVRTIALGPSSRALPTENGGARSGAAPTLQLSAWTPRGRPGVLMGLRF